MQQRYYSSPPLDTDADAAPARRPWAMMLLLTVLFFFIHPHRLDESTKFKAFAQSSDGSEEETAADASAAAVAEGSSTRRLGLAALVLASLGSFLTFRGPALTLNGWLGVLCVAFLGLMLMSPLWSAESSLAIRRVIAIGMLIFGALAVARRFSMEDLLLFIILAAGSYLLIGVIAEIRYGNFRPWAGGYRFSGTIHPNQQGINCTILTLATIAYAVQAQQGRRLLWAIAGIAFVFLVLTGSRTSLASALFGIGVFAWLWFPKQDMLRYGVFAVACGALLLGFGAVTAGDQLDEKLGAAVMMGRNSDSSEASTLNGRIPLWRELGGYVAERPFLGYGYKSFWTPHRILRISHHQGWWMMQAHNGYLEMTLSLGLVGSGLFVGIVVLSIQSALRIFSESRTAGAAFAAALLCWVAANTMLEAWIDEPVLPSLIALSVIVSLASLETPLWQRTTAESVVGERATPVFSEHSMPAIG